jgi:hypothetical protein
MNARRHAALLAVSRGARARARSDSARRRVRLTARAAPAAPERAPYLSRSRGVAWIVDALMVVGTAAASASPRRTSAASGTGSPPRPASP